MSYGTDALSRRKQQMDALRDRQMKGEPVDTAGIEKTAKQLSDAFSDKPDPKAFNNAAQPSFVPQAQQKPPIP